MDITVNLTRLDLFLMNLFVFPRMKGNWVFLLVLWAGLIAYHVISQGCPCGFTETLFVLFATGVGAIGGIVFMLLFGTVWLIAFSTKKSGVLGEHYYAIREDGLFEKTDANETITRWPSIISIWKVGSFILVRINSYLFHTFPRSAFKSQQEFESFYETLVANWQRSG